MKNKIQSEKKIPNFDALRAFLAITVVLTHIPVLCKVVGLPYYYDTPFLDRGFDAVQVFFNLSGYLIIGLLYDEKTKFGSVNIKNFYMRRILRLYPVYYLVLIFGLIFYHCLVPALNIDSPPDYTIWEGFIWNAAFLPNMFRILHDPGFILLILWSIGIEEQFYLFIAPFIYLIPKKYFFKSLIIFTVLYLSIFHIDFFKVLEKYMFFYFYISFGGIMAIIARKKNRFKFLFHPFLVYSNYLLFIIYFATNWFSFEYTLLTAILKMLIFGLIIIHLAHDKNLNITNKSVNYLGKISYGIYMYHVIIMHIVIFVIQKFQLNNYLENTTFILFTNALCIIGTIIFAHLSYKYYETYFLKLKNKFRKKSN